MDKMSKAKINLLIATQTWCVSGRGLHKHYKFFNFIKAIKEKNRYNKQRTKCFCPKCDNELCGSNSYQNLMNDLNRYEYFKCSQCKTESKWDFDCIIPLLVPYTSAVGEVRNISLNITKDKQTNLPEKDNQRDTTEYKNLALWKEKEGYVIRKGFGRVGCYIDGLYEKDLERLYKLLENKLCKTTGVKIATKDGKKNGLKNVQTATKKKLK
jgi:hypothetical protein